MLFARRFGYDSEEQRILVRSIHEVMGVMQISSIFRTVSFVNLLPTNKKEKKLMVNVGELKNFK